MLTKTVSMLKCLNVICFIKVHLRLRRLLYNLVVTYQINVILLLLTMRLVP